VKNFAEQTRKQ